MKKIILMVFLVLGVMSFSAMDKVIIVVQNDNYETPFITGTYSRGMLADTLFSGSKDSGHHDFMHFEDDILKKNL